MSEPILAIIVVSSLILGYGAIFGYAMIGYVTAEERKRNRDKKNGQKTA